jgi:hypothetical protein
VGGRGLYIELQNRVWVTYLIDPKKNGTREEPYFRALRNWAVTGVTVFCDMAEQFIGMTVSLTLSNSAQLKGTVSKVDSTTQILHLRDGISIPSSATLKLTSFFISSISS